MLESFGLALLQVVGAVVFGLWLYRSFVSAQPSGAKTGCLPMGVISGVLALLSFYGTLPIGILIFLIAAVALVYPAITA